MTPVELRRIAERLPSAEQLKILSGQLRKEHGLDTHRDSLYHLLRFRGVSDFYAQVGVFYKRGLLSIKPEGDDTQTG